MKVFKCVQCHRETTAGKILPYCPHCRGPLDMVMDIPDRPADLTTRLIIEEEKLITELTHAEDRRDAMQERFFASNSDADWRASVDAQKAVLAVELKLKNLRAHINNVNATIRWLDEQGAA